MTRNVKQRSASDTEADSAAEIWRIIRYLDPDRELRRSDIVFGAIWVLSLISLCVLIFLLQHWKLSVLLRGFRVRGTLGVHSCAPLPPGRLVGTCLRRSRSM
jgi:hypothetical protein